jgi:hypothetical protein
MRVVSDPIEPLRRERFAFRSRLQECFGRRTDVLFELCNALLTAGSVSSPVHLTRLRSPEGLEQLVGRTGEGPDRRGAIEGVVGI